MQFHPTNTQLRLLTIEDVKSDRWQQNLPWESAPQYLAVAWWLENFLCQPHPDLGREGPVCPFVLPAINRETLWLTGHEGSIPNTDILTKVVLPYRDWFLDLPPKTGEDHIFKVILIVFPGLHNHDGFKLIDQAQEVLKPVFVPKGMMVGQFHPFCDEPGVRSPEFKPLRCPVSMLAIRFMTRYDLPFLVAPHYFQEYQPRFGHEVPDHLMPIYNCALAQSQYAVSN